MSIVAVPWRAAESAARCSGQAPHTTTGSVSPSATHCHRGNCSAGTIDSTTTGTASATQAAARAAAEASRADSSASSSCGGAAGVIGTAV